ncbi:hypothetical protein DFH29DRAFT_1010464 [Suillus ampliporus]|nr:hypothetical protein DFH29DRAFT_1010464 [Suillus ampliporus]
MYVTNFSACSARKPNQNDVSSSLSSHPPSRYQNSVSPPYLHPALHPPRLPLPSLSTLTPACFPRSVPYLLWLWFPGASSLTFRCAELFLSSPIALFPAAPPRPSSLTVFPALSSSRHAFPPLSVS